MNLHAAVPASADLATIKGRQQDAWASGDYAVIGTTLQIVGETLCEAVDLRSNQRVLDVAAGNSNATLAAARRFADVVSTDYVGALLERGRERAAADRSPSRSGKPTRRRFLSRMRAWTSCSRPSASCSRQIRQRPQAN